jgi:hypothetical protein
MSSDHSISLSLLIPLFIGSVMLNATRCGGNEAAFMRKQLYMRLEQVVTHIRDCSTSDRLTPPNSPTAERERSRAELMAHPRHRVGRSAPDMEANSGNWDGDGEPLAVCSRGQLLDDPCGGFVSTLAHMRVVRGLIPDALKYGAAIERWRQNADVERAPCPSTAPCA